MRILLTGAAGFFGGYVAAELLAAGHEVIGLDNFSKYGPVRQTALEHRSYDFVEGDAKNVDLLVDLMGDVDQVIAGAAMTGGISYFHAFAYDLLAENTRITAATFDAAIEAHRRGRLQKINVITSAMVYESTQNWPTPEGEERRCPPPRSTYGFGMLAAEYFAQGAWEQHKLPYTIIRPFNTVGLGEHLALCEGELSEGNLRMATSHVVPDLVRKVLTEEGPLRLLGDGKQIRQYIYGGDVARGIHLCVEKPEAVNQDFNLCTDAAISVLELAELIWKKCRPGEPFRYVCDLGYPNDVRKRVPSVEKAARLLGFRATTSLGAVLDMVIPWMKKQLHDGNL
jgi:UDP-glucose 4-epimerase